MKEHCCCSLDPNNNDYTILESTNATKIMFRRINDPGIMRALVMELILLRPEPRWTGYNARDCRRYGAARYVQRVTTRGLLPGAPRPWLFAGTGTWLGRRSVFCVFVWMSDHSCRPSLHHFPFSSHPSSLSRPPAIRVPKMLKKNAVNWSTG